MDDVTRETLELIAGEARHRWRTNGYRLSQAFFGWAVGMSVTLGDIPYRELRLMLRQQMLDDFERYFPDQDTDTHE
jgi:hypothetical protein